jgi:hypothetical protein
MEWLVPVLFVLASLAQWWMQRNRQSQEEELPDAMPPKERSNRSGPTRPEPEPREEFGDFGELLEALGRRRHESPPQKVQPVEPPVILAPERPLAPTPEPVVVLESAEPISVPVAFPEPKPFRHREPEAVFAMPETPRATFRPFPQAATTSAGLHRWGQKLRSPASVREAVILSEILAPPVALR